MNRPSNVPEGAHVQWEIELLGFEMPKVMKLLKFSKHLDSYVLRSSLLFCYKKNDILVDFKLIVLSCLKTLICALFISWFVNFTENRQALLFNLSETFFFPALMFRKFHLLFCLSILENSKGLCGYLESIILFFDHIDCILALAGISCEI